MTLFFNLSVDGTLDDFELEANFATQDVSCGSDNPIPGSYQQFQISSTIINYLNNNYGAATVGNLFDLANKALGGLNIGGLSHSNINAAVDAINNAFDGCRVQVPYQNQSHPVVILPTTPTQSSLLSTNPTFTVYPVPFKENLTVKYEFDYKTNATIQIFDAKGALLQSQDDTNAYLNKEVVIQPKFKMGEGQMFFIKVITDRGVTVKKVISGN